MCNHDIKNIQTRYFIKPKKHILWIFMQIYCYKCGCIMKTLTKAGGVYD